jgi:ADP-ribose pyrophosphatase YjhB (NUDIX family)
MPLKPKYCSQCGTAVVAQVVNGCSRLACPACDTVFYENPLPVAAAVVLNGRREVLLVQRQREPHQGMWCLPMGFAEMHETIAQAAQRELHEETGVKARVLRLLDADSFESSFYGELLIVTFELEKVAGQEQAGDDATEVRYFPLAGHPQLAFSSNEIALRACAAAHQEEWAIQDSFVTLQGEEDRGMLSDLLVTLIEERAEEVARLWLADVRTNPTTISYRASDPEQLLQRVTQALAKLGSWLRGDVAPNEVKAFYQDVGRERRAQRYKVHEVLSALTLLRKHVWAFARAHAVWQRPIDVYRLLELNRRIAVFFDQALYRVARGFDADAPV